jgi:acetyl-CoA acetyltransferase family protein
MEAVIQGARAIALGDAELIIAGGVESMTRAPLVMGKAGSSFGREQKLEDTTLGWRFANPLMEKIYGIDSLTQTAENLSVELEISRADQDAFAWRSQQRAAQALASGFFSGEIAPLKLKNARGEVHIIDRDEHPRADTQLEKLAKLPTLISNGTVTAGNCSGINDGAAALLLASEAAINEFNLTPLARIESSAAAGVAPRLMGIGPVPATEKLLHKMQLQLSDFDVIELNEAFAAQVLACTRSWELSDDAEKINPNGGAIALGHPLGMSGARLVLTAARELQRRKGHRALCTLCIGVGQGVSLSIQRV